MKEQILNYDTLHDAMNKCKRNTMWKDSVSHFVHNASEELSALENEVITNTYACGKPYMFKIHSPKERDIVSIRFRDRVLQRALNDEYVYPTMTKSFIETNAACQTGKGTDFARAKLRKYLFKAFINFGSNAFYILKLDIKGYYPNMSHDIVEEMFREKLDPEIYELVEKILHSQYPGDTGYNPGSQLIQIAGISLLDPLDHYIKEQLKCKYYIRYMDDFIIIDQDSSRLEEIKSIIKDKLYSDYHLELNEKKSFILKAEDGVMFLGFKNRVTETGKIIMSIDPDTIRRGRKHFSHMVRASINGKIPKEAVDAAFECWISYVKKGNSFKLIQELTMFYKELWRKYYDIKCNKKEDIVCYPQVD